MIPLIETEDYNVGTVYLENKVLVDFPDKTSAFIRHKKIRIIFESKKGPKLEILMTGKMNFYRTVWMDRVSAEKITEEVAISEFKRLLGDKWETAFKMAKVRMALGI